MPSHAPLCGINRPHARYWSRTNRIDSILESPPVTPDTATVPPPTRSPEPKVTRYIVIRNDQHGGSPHHGKIFIVAGNRLAAVHPTEKRSLHSVTIARAQAPLRRVRRPAPRRVPRPPARPARKIFGARPSGTPREPRRRSPTRPDPSRVSATGPTAPATLPRASAISSRPGAPKARGPHRGPASQPEGARPRAFQSYADASARPGRNDCEDFFPDVRNESYNCTNPSRSWAGPGYSPAFTTQLRWPRTRRGGTGEIA
jgi:hypothetical protein